MASPEPMCLHASAHHLGLSEERLGHRNPGVREREEQLEVSTWRGTFRAEITPIAFVKETALAPLILKGVNSTTLLYTYLE